MHCNQVWPAPAGCRRAWIGMMLASSLLLSTGRRAESQPALNLNPRPQTCAPDFQGLVQQMLPALPSITNRIYTRSNLERQYMIIASAPNFEALPLQSRSEPQDPAESEPQQVFFTTRTRRYRNQKVEELQEYHWLFLTRSDTGWRFSMLYSIAGQYPQTNPPSPPRNSSEGAVAAAIRDWLRDCRLTR
ncbi:hypothetical protein C1752_04313 [Acaryochloris thomasi RCC1774]|uniref:Uncharacterized protein n=1 Tax=Acaryochloris thomasi RCC1774 TaxID=1764569 RepID=A0A2W1JDQ3_9CYAN|nr:hypothetical protein [Acaryochloris thomasi]PZD71953.1 hypothetical protein C1752_04313 [Acaryochloris thomasi RCC1774]